jgi:hypothetical protein
LVVPPANKPTALDIGTWPALLTAIVMATPSSTMRRRRG